MLQTDDAIRLGGYILDDRIIEFDLPSLFETGNPVDGYGIFGRIGNLHLLRFHAVGQFIQFDISDTHLIAGSILDSQHFAGSLITVHHHGEHLHSYRGIGATGIRRFDSRLDVSNLLEGRNIPRVIHHTEL